MKPIAIGKISKMHGLPKAGRCKYLLELYAPGSLLLKDKEKLLLGSTLTSSDWQSIDLSGPVQPHRAGWGHQRFVLISVPESLELERDQEIALDRNEFPPLGEHEFYVCDVIGLEVLSETDEVQGKVVSFEAMPGGGVNLEVAPGNDKPNFFVPSQWVEKIDEEKKTLRIPGLSEWSQLVKDSPKRGDDVD